MLEQVLGPGRLTPWFQPVVSTGSGSVIRFEALVRFERPDGSVLAPYEILPELEKAGRSAELFPLMLVAALAACRQWRSAGVPAGVAVNVTSGDLREPGLPARVTAALAGHGLPPEALTLELSEQELLEAGRPAAAALGALRSAGIRVAIDDFGAGHSSLARLADVPVSELKIDRSLVMSADADPRRQIVLRSSVDLGHRLGLEVVAEGVEDDAVAGTVTAVGADAIQGYLFSRPIPLPDLLNRYAAGPTRTAQAAETPVRSDVGRVRTARAKVAAAVPDSWRADPATGRTVRQRVRSTFGVKTLAFALANIALILVWTFLEPAGHEAGLWVGNLDFVPVAGFTAWTALQTGRRFSGRQRSAWILLALAATAYLVGDVLQWLMEAVLQVTAFPGPPDVGFLSFYVLAMVGVLSLGRPLRNPRVRRVLLVDVLTVMTGATAVIGLMVLRPAIPEGQALAPKLVAAAYPVGDLLLLFAGTHVLLRGTDVRLRPPLQLLIVSFGCFVLTDSIYVNTSDYDGTSFVNVGWIIALTFLLLAAAAGRNLAPGTGSVPPLSGTAGSRRLARLPHVAVAATYLLLLKTHAEDRWWPDRSILFVGFFITGLVVLRQHLTMRDNRKLAQAYDALATCDELTGLSTRRHFLTEAEREMALATRSEIGTALVLLDIDHFGSINERYGQQAGDQVLTAVAEACRNQLRQGDLLGRYGGDEIIALLPHSSAAAAEAIAQRINAHLDGLCIDTATGPVVARISHGVAYAPSGDRLEDGLMRVSAALAQAKQAAGVTRSGTSDVPQDLAALG